MRLRAPGLQGGTSRLVDGEREAKTASAGSWAKGREGREEQIVVMGAMDCRSWPQRGRDWGIM